MRIRCHRAEVAHKRASPKRSQAEARTPKGSGPFCFCNLSGMPLATSQRRASSWTALAVIALHGTAARPGGCSLTTCCEARSTTGTDRSLASCGHGSVGRARPPQGRSPGFEPRCPLHFGCVFTTPPGISRVDGLVGCAGTWTTPVQRCRRGSALEARPIA